MVSFIQSNYRGFGSGIVIPGTGISMNDRMENFRFDPAHANCLEGGKRPYHTIIWFPLQRGQSRRTLWHHGRLHAASGACAGCGKSD